MSTTPQDRYFMAAPLQKAADSMYRHPTYDGSFDSVRYTSNASQPSLSHSFNTYTESYPSSLCRPDFGDYPTDMTHSDCGASFSEVPPSLDDTSDVDEAPHSSLNQSRPSLLKFVEPIVHREQSHGQPRLTGMKGRMLRKKASATGRHDSEIGVAHLPVLGFTDSSNSYDAEDVLHTDALRFPDVPPRGKNSGIDSKHRDMDMLDIGLENLTLGKDKAESTPVSLNDKSAVSRVMATKRDTAPSVFDEAEHKDRSYPTSPRTRRQSDARRAALPPPVEPLPPLPPLKSPAAIVSNKSASSVPNKAPRLRAGDDLPLSVLSAQSSVEDLFAFKPPSLNGHSDDQQSTIRAPHASRITGPRHDSMSSSTHSSLRDMDPREMIQRARLQPLSCGLDSELDHSTSVASPYSSLALPQSSDNGVSAEDLPPLLSNHYLQGQVDTAEYERLNRLPVRMQALAAVSSSSSQRLTQKHMSKQRKSQAAPVNYEPISILRAEAAFLQEDGRKSDKKKKDRLWSGSNSTSSDVSTLSEGPQKFKSLRFLRSHK